MAARKGKWGLQSVCMLMLLRELRNKPKQGRDDCPEAGELGGLRVMKAISRARAVQRHQDANPIMTCEVYHEQWEHTLSAEG